MLTAMIALMVRVPVPGKVKTRLIPRLGAEGSCRLYRAMVEDILRHIAASGLPVGLFYTGGTLEQVPKSWQGQAALCLEQQGQDLGARMLHGLTSCHQRAARVILIGSDIPDMTSSVFLEALENLNTSPLVLTPARDGGYCLLATRKETDVQPILTDMIWSTEQVLAETLRRLQARGEEVALLPSLRDMDTADDLEQYANNPNPQARSTNQVLASLQASGNIQ